MTARRLHRSAVLALLVLGSVTAASRQLEWKYTALGDSLATGYLAQAGYVPRYQGHLQTDNGASTTLYNLGQNGATSTRLLTLLRTDPVVDSAVRTADVLTWNIGLNDFRNARTSYKSKKCGGKDNQDCLRQMVTVFRGNWGASLIEILNRRSVGNTILRTMDVYNPWVNIDRTANTFADSREPAVPRGTDLQVLTYYLGQLNAEIALSADANAIPYARAFAAFNGASGTDDPITKGYLAADNLHPSEAGHAVLAELLRALQYTPLR